MGRKRKAAHRTEIWFSKTIREKATKEADVIVNAEIEKRKIEIDAEAEAEKQRRLAHGEADAIFAKMEAQAKGMNEILVRQAEGFKAIVDSTNGNAQEAAMLMIADKLEDLVKIQVEAVKNLKIDKVTVWDNMGGSGGNGQPATANFLSGMMKSIPPMNELFQMAGLQLPEFLVKEMDDKKDLMVNNEVAKLDEEDVVVIEE
jgi:flotillin